MPIFEYVCRSCRHPFETLVRGATDTPVCPACGSTALDRRLSVFAVAASSRSTAEATAPCARCGDPRGAGACALD
ncbi:MAG TPA: zinc ribbon domain-containing protein [Vicinamibacterales bacterium]|nr:zinc ribbon domain-containing protein [Vicinamibacterales bacterium]